MKREGIVGAVTKIAQPLVSELGYTLWDVEYVKEGAEMYLRITIDKADGITIDDCERVHRAIDPLLDEADPIEESYHLEISSPGIERDLRTDAQILSSLGSDVEVRLYAPTDGCKRFLGTLSGLTEDGIEILCDGSKRCFPKSAVASLKTTYSFDEN